MKNTNLMYFTGVGLIVKSKSGVTYHHQSGDIACSRSAIEGVLIMLPEIIDHIEAENSIAYQLSRLMEDCEGLSTTQVKTVNEILSSHHDYSMLTVDESLKKQARDNWLHVHIGKSQSPALHEFSGMSGVLVMEVGLIPKNYDN